MYTHLRETVVLLHLFYQLLSVCIISSHELSAEEVSRITNCSLLLRNESRQSGCNPLNNYEQVDEDSAANITLHCTGVNLIMIKFNPGVYLIEQSLSVDDWDYPIMIAGSIATFRNLTAGSSYRYRFHRWTKNGFARSEISDWFKTYQADYRPLPVVNVFLSKMDVDERNGLMRAEIVFEPDKDASCSYIVLPYHGEHHLVPFELREISDFRFVLTHLGYDQSNNITISSSNGEDTEYSDKTYFAFKTPSCLHVHNNLTICRPEKVKGLRAEHRYQFGALYDVTISWDNSRLEPDNYTVQLDLLQGEASLRETTLFGNETAVSFAELELGPEYNVKVIAESPGGRSPPAKLNKHVIKGIYNFYREIVIGLAIVILIGVICLQSCRRRNTHFTMKYTHFEPVNQKDESLETTKKKLQRDYSIDSSEVPLISDQFDVCPKYLTLKAVIGSGAYGIVKLGSLRDESHNVIDVAVKMLRDNPSAEDLRNFRQEISIMKSVGQHPNILSLIGCCTIRKKLVLVVEYCCKGDLQSYLRMIWQGMIGVTLDQRTHITLGAELFIDSGVEYRSNNSAESAQNFKNVRTITNRLYDIQQDVAQSTESVTAGDLLNFARQIATGMEFLASNRIVHRDLAARNVLVCKDKIVKISDFGLSRDIYQENLYRKQGNSKLPLKWMAIESLTHQIYTTHSDVWSFGILLWEIVTMGALPYPGIPTDAVLKFLKSGHRMERPQNCSVILYDIMSSCWNVRPQSRPTFTELKESLDKLLSCYCENEYLNMSKAVYSLEDRYHTSNEKLKTCN